MRTINQLFLAGLLAMLITGCSVDCSTTTNAANANGAMSDGGADLATAYVGAVENPSRPEWILSVTVLAMQGSTGAPLRGHLLAARLLSPSGEILRELPIAPPSYPAETLVSDGSLLRDAAAYGRVRDALLTGRSTIVFETDLPDRTRLVTVLDRTHYAPAEHRTCPYT